MITKQEYTELEADYQALLARYENLEKAYMIMQHNYMDESMNNSKLINRVFGNKLCAFIFRHFTK